ncbi:MAG TPA: hypothetical protein VE196_09305 [Pseudonocardiaceae bacterium]|nr:hypothetical protein [Pseudonocardiaceae bacterium]
MNTQHNSDTPGRGRGGANFARRLGCAGPGVGADRKTPGDRGRGRRDVLLGRGRPSVAESSTWMLVRSMPRVVAAMVERRRAVPTRTPPHRAAPSRRESAIGQGEVRG